MKKLSPAMLDLLQAMQSGVVVHYMPFSRGYDDYYFRSDTRKSCTKQVVALVDRGLAETLNKDYRMHVRLTAQGEAYKA